LHFSFNSIQILIGFLVASGAIWLRLWESPIKSPNT
jgi:hypothetical protein